MTVTERIDEVEARFIEGLTTLHERVVDANTQAAERLAALRPGTPATPENVPTATDVVSRYYDFASKVLEANRSFAEQLVAAWEPNAETPSIDERPAATSTARDTAAEKPSAKKASAKKASAKKASSKKASAKKASK
ncbi:MAG: hypothetical protein OEV40_11420 [Acidimicrobiia bacterium]|nr:hypothetical protein [Acidimicrobiia bacterium]